jgi:DNA invertase Pin-like site-specific DNA recombinase
MVMNRQSNHHRLPNVRVAQYVRMSTDSQRYSIDNQVAAIALYAASRGFLIVRTYADEGKSGLSVKGRRGLTRLIDDIQSRRTDFEAILVYDVSRWGRFQDVDESAYYEFICRQAGFSVHYCAEEFENDGSLVATIVKTIKRAMAADYSRGLSNRVFTAKRNMTLRGFRHGGRAGFGLRRMVIDEHGSPKGTLENGQQKFTHADRTILVPGPPEEVATVRWAFEVFARTDMSINAIARDLNARGIKNSIGRPWRGNAVRDLLSNEKYIGHNIFNKTSVRLKSKRVRNRPAEWVRADGVFEPIVSRALFEQAQARIAIFKRRTKRFDLLDHLTALWCKHGELSSKILERSPTCPSTATYTKYFGSLLEAFKEVGYPKLTRRPVYVSVRKTISDSVVDRVKAADGTARRIGLRRQTRLLVNEQLTITIALAHWAYATRDARPRWVLGHSTHHRSDIVVLARFDEKLRRLRDYFVLPGVILDNPQQVILDANHIEIESFRFDTLEQLESLFARRTIDFPVDPADRLKKYVAQRRPPIKMDGSRPQLGARSSTVAKLFRSFEAQSGRMKSFIERARVIAARQQRLERILKLLLSDPTFCRVLFEEQTEALPAIVVQRLSGLSTGCVRPSQDGRSAGGLGKIGGSSQASECGSLLRRVSPGRQEEIAEIMAMSADRSLSFLRLLVLASKKGDFVRSRKMPRGVRPNEMKLIAREIGSLEEAFRAAAATYPDDAYALVFTEAYLRSLLKNARIAAYLRSVQPKLFAETSQLPGPGAPLLSPSS